MSIMTEQQLKYLQTRLNGVMSNTLQKFKDTLYLPLDDKDSDLYFELQAKLKTRVNAIYDKAMFGGDPYTALKELKEFEGVSEETLY